MKHRRPADEALTEIENAIEIELHGDSQGDSNRQVVAELRAWANVLRVAARIEIQETLGIVEAKWEDELMLLLRRILRARKIEARRKP